MKKSSNNSQTASNRWILYRSVGYLNGRGLIYDGGSVVPHESQAPDTYAIEISPAPTPTSAVTTQDLSVFADSVWDYVFVGAGISDIRVDDPPQLLKDLCRKVRIGGHLICALPTQNFTLDNLESAVGLHGSWKAKDTCIRGDWVLSIYKRVQGARGIKPRTPRPPKRACITRYGAIGDMIIATPLIRRLAEDGYHVTVNTTKYSASVLENNPHVGNIILQERAAIPNVELGPYWDEWRKDYDKYIGLSESLEGGLLKVEGRRDFYTHASWRRDVCNKNYYDHTLGIGGYKDCRGRVGEIYFSRQEQRARDKLAKMYDGRFLIAATLNGTSHHKMYPLFGPVLRDWLDLHPKARVVLLGDKSAKQHVFEHGQVEDLVNNTSLREAFRYVAVASCVVGPETAMTNAAGAFDTPVITFLSHSTHENFCKNFTHDYCLAPDVALAPCYPCHMLHYSLETCPQGELVDTESDEIAAKGPLCALGAIQGDRLLARLDEVYERHFVNPVETPKNGIIDVKGKEPLEPYGSVESGPATHSSST